MKNMTNSLYYSRIETETSIVIVWKPFSAYITIVLLMIAVIGSLCSIAALSIAAFCALIINAVIYSADCKKPRTEINEAIRTSSVQLRGKKFSFSSPLTVIITKEESNTETICDYDDISKRGGIVKKVILGILTALFLILGFFVLSAMFLGIRQNAYVVSTVLLLVMGLAFLLLALLCYKGLKK